METLIPSVIGFIFYWFGRFLLLIITFGKLEAIPIIWSGRKDWKFGVFIHEKDGRSYLEYEWVSIFGFLIFLIFLVLIFKFVI